MFVALSLSVGSASTRSLQNQAKEQSLVLMLRDGHNVGSF